MGHILRETLEQEVKLSAPPRFRLPDLPGEPLAPRVFTSTYFDTKDYRLARVGITLRRRVEHGKGLWQLKLPRGVARLELEIPGGPNALPTEFADLLLAFHRHHEFQPIAKLRTHRVGILVQGVNGPLAEVVHDRVVLRDGKRIAGRLDEIELELRGGDAALLEQLEQRLRQAGATDGDHRPKVFHLLGLPFPEQIPRADPTASTIDHLKANLYNQVLALLVHDPGTRFGKDIEELHQMRVAVRRLRAFLRIGRSFFSVDWVTQLRAELEWLGDALGSVRDLDVLLENLHQEVATLSPSDRQIFRRLLARLEADRSKARGTMLETLRSPRYLELTVKFDEMIEAPPLLVSGFSLAELAAREFRKLRRAVNALEASSTDEEWHELRIKAKRARYAAELAEGSVGKLATRFLRQIKKLQDLLGSHQDSSVAESRLRELLHNSRSIKSAFTVGQIVERLRSRRDQLRTQFPDVWRKVKKRGKEAWATGQPT